jgi:heme exporter protein B
MIGPFALLVRRDLTLAFRDGGAIGTALGFYLIVVTMLPLGLGPDLKLLSRIAPGMLWIALLLAALLSLSRLFEADDEDGSLDALAAGPLPLEAVVAAKALAHWLSTGIPLTLLTPLLGLLLNLDLSSYGPLMATMLIGTPAISFLGAAGAALTLKARKGGLLVALLVLPLYIPTLIFGISAVSAITLDTGGFRSANLILAAITLGSLVIGPWAAATAIRLQLQS